MIILDYGKKFHKEIIGSCVQALKKGRVVAYPTDTSYGLAVDAGNLKAVRRMFEAVKLRDYKRPLPLAVPSVSSAKKVVQWNRLADRLANRFWPGALTLVLPASKGFKPAQAAKVLSANTGFLGVRIPKNSIAADLARGLRRPITATSANISGQPEAYDIQDILSQFERQTHKPDIIINGGPLPKRKPSTVVKIEGENWEVLREGPISERQILKAFGTGKAQSPENQMSKQ